MLAGQGQGIRGAAEFFTLTQSWAVDNTPLMRVNVKLLDWTVGSWYYRGHELNENLGVYRAVPSLIDSGSWRALSRLSSGVL